MTKYSSESDYKILYEKVYCDPSVPIYTFDGIRVIFFNDRFEHAFYRSSIWKKRNKDVFSSDRAERIMWIKDTLLDKSADLRIGWDRDLKSYTKSRRVAIVVKDYVVVIRIQNNNTAKFITAYIADNNALKKLKAGPKWNIK